MPNGVLRDLYKDAQEVHLRLKLRVDFRLLSSYTFSCTRLVVLVVHDGALVSAPEYQNRLSKKLNLRGHSMLHLNVCLKFYFREHLKMYKNVKEKMHLSCT